MYLLYGNHIISCFETLKNCITTDLTLQYCNAPKSADQLLESADSIPTASEDFPTPVTSPPRPPKPPRTKESRYSRRNLAKKEACFHIRILKPLQTEKEEEKLKGNSCEKAITSSYSSRQNSKEDLSSYAINNSAHERKLGNMFPSTHARSIQNEKKEKRRRLKTPSH